MIQSDELIKGYCLIFQKPKSLSRVFLRDEVIVNA
jgi:hypothetical protein